MFISGMECACVYVMCKYVQYILSSVAICMCSACVLCLCMYIHSCM